MDVEGKPLLQRVIDRCQSSNLITRVVVATSDADTDADLVSYCENQNVEFFCGPLDNVVERLFLCSRNCEADAFVRVNGDSPLIDSTLIDEGVRLYQSSGVDLVSNVWPRSFPKGQSVEVVCSSALEGILSGSPAASDLEHVTTFFYRNSDRFKIRNFSSEKDFSFLQLSVDELSDLDDIRKIIRLRGPAVNWLSAAKVKAKMNRSTRGE